MAAPPSDGAVNVTVAVLDPVAVAVPIIGAPGTVAGTALPNINPPATALNIKRILYST
jgi:hypothetical protein